MSTALSIESNAYPSSCQSQSALANVDKDQTAQNM